MRQLEPPDSHYLQAAEGWLGLGDAVEAFNELENIAPRLRAHPDVLKLRWMIFAKQGQWQSAVEIAEGLVQLLPNDAFGFIHRSFALRRLNGIQAAWDKLLPVADKFKDNWIVPYNLACYACQLGDMAGAENWLKKSFEIGDKEAKAAALEDEDLKPLWDSMSGSSWKLA